MGEAATKLLITGCCLVGLLVWLATKWLACSSITWLACRSKTWLVCRSKAWLSWATEALLACEIASVLLLTQAEVNLGGLQKLGALREQKPHANSQNQQLNQP